MVAPLAFKVSKSPLQSFNVEAVTVTVGVFTTTGMESTTLQLALVLVAVTVYSVVTDGVALTLFPVVLFNPVLGLHVYVNPLLGEAVRVAFCPEQRPVLAELLTVIVAVLPTLTITIAVALQPEEVTPVTVYVVVTDGTAVTEAPVEELKLILGAHVYVDAPLAVNLLPLPLQIICGDAVAVTFGVATITVSLIVVLQPSEVVPVTE
jgi:hypothetical protein